MPRDPAGAKRDHRDGGPCGGSVTRCYVRHIASHIARAAQSVEVGRAPGMTLEVTVL